MQGAACGVLGNRELALIPFLGHCVVCADETAYFQHPTSNVHRTRVLRCECVKRPTCPLGSTAQLVEVVDVHPSCHRRTGRRKRLAEVSCVGRSRKAQARRPQPGRRKLTTSALTIPEAPRVTPNKNTWRSGRLAPFRWLNRISPRRPRLPRIYPSWDPAGACEQVASEKDRGPLARSSLLQPDRRLRKQQSPHAGLFYGRYWARTSDPQLVDSEQPFASVRWCSLKQRG